MTDNLNCITLIKEKVCLALHYRNRQVNSEILIVTFNQKTVSKGAVNTIKIVSDSLHIQAAHTMSQLLEQSR